MIFYLPPSLPLSLLSPLAYTTLLSFLPYTPLSLHKSTFALHLPTYLETQQRFDSLELTVRARQS